MRAAAVIVAALLLLATQLTVLTQIVHADQLGTRSIRMSDSANSGGTVTSGVGSGTNVSYQVSFTTSASAGSLVIDFCEENPIIGDDCTAPTGMTAATGITPVTGNIGGAGWTFGASAGQVQLSSGGSNNATAGAQVFTLTGITNPSAVGSFYARIYTYANGTQGTYVDATDVGNYVDYGGIALSTVPLITINGRVLEQLTFCVTKAAPTTWTTTNDCSDPVVSNANNLPALTIGHTSGGSSTPVIDSTAVDRGTLYSQLSTNAVNGAAISLRNGNSCGGLSADNGVTCGIPPVNGGSGAGASAITAGTAAFGLFVSTSTANPNGGSGTITPAAAYYNASHADQVTPDLWYGMDTTGGTGVTSTYGSTLATASAPVYRVQNNYVFAATASLTTRAGIYAANMSMIATGTF